MPISLFRLYPIKRKNVFAWNVGDSHRSYYVAKRIFVMIKVYYRVALWDYLSVSYFIGFFS